MKNKVQVIRYNGKAGLLELLDEAEESFFNLFEEAARHGWIDGDRFLEMEQELSHMVIKYDVPQSPSGV